MEKLKDCLNQVGTLHEKILILIAFVSMFFSCGQNQKSNKEAEVDSIKSSKLIALSFDDGPTTTTVQMLDMLEKHGIKGSSYVIGKNINDSKRKVISL